MWGGLFFGSLHILETYVQMTYIYIYEIYYLIIYYLIIYTRKTENNTLNSLNLAALGLLVSFLKFKAYSTEL